MSTHAASLRRWARDSMEARIMPAHRLTLTSEEVDSLCALVGRYRYADVLWKLMGGVRDDGTMRAEVPHQRLSELKRAVEEEEEFLPSCGGTLAAKIASLLNAAL
jgi:hypothetical protein